MSNYRLSIVTPVGKIFEDEVSSLVAPGSEGGFGVLSKHAPSIIALKNGVLKITQNGQEKFFTIGPGYFEMNPQNQALILVDAASEAKNFEEAKEKANSSNKI